MNTFCKELQKINTIDGAKEILASSIQITQNIKKAVDFCIVAHDKQYRKSGEPYAVHPILVATITAYFSNDESMVIAALLHDVVEDTPSTIEDVEHEYGVDVARIVDGLTKIVEIREHELTSSTSHEKLLSSALSFRKMLIASIEDVRVLVIKLCDRLHNMLTLDALKREKQIRIAEETLVVYAPIAHRLGISTLKNDLEDLAFFYIYPEEYKEIDNYLQEYQSKIQLKLNDFVSNTKSLLEYHGFNAENLKIFSRIKHHYSIFLKMQRKGISIDEILDLLAIRILVDNPIECYDVLGHIHMKYKPLIARFKDYVSTPKENGYQTIHTTVFYDSSIYEVQIRTFDMNKVAEYGVAAHWKYKSGLNAHSPNLKWLHSLEFENENIEEFYSDAKQDLYSEEIVVYSPKGNTFALPRGATALDFAYLIHTDLGNCAVESFVNNVKVPLLTELKSSDIISIKTTDHQIPRCSWIDMVKTTRAKKAIKLLCSTRLREIDESSGKNIVNTIFSRYKTNVLSELDYQVKFYKIPVILDYLKEVKKKITEQLVGKLGFVTRLKLQNLKFREYKIDKVVFYSNFSINNLLFEHCCHPKFGDDIVAFKEKSSAVIHHKMCNKAYKKILNGDHMLFCKWEENKLHNYKMVVSIPNVKGELAKLLTYLSVHDINIVFIEYGRDKISHTRYCEIEFETTHANKEHLKTLIEKRVKIIDFFSKADAYK
ncbi:RelA/SpoT family protein [Arcobacter sp. FWKO B]|uniref:RelA/SpoT family protein n=1 Tax=Arcobacter sp. FWKO B TaxID=2593672 RepID=UPI0018A415B7|nr:RelA/SpoT family protein [Arcobacter sp. FWKO B]QOG13089.1 bifunctional (p)ppGpp synthetase/guanosine-3',5'-bis(diphosphate) 3'-pyrophosphohydrolase [Arcobacter sp. FWKO B]